MKEPFAGACVGFLPREGHPRLAHEPSIASHDPAWGSCMGS